MVNVNGTNLKKMFHNGTQVKKWIHNDREVYKSELQIVKNGNVLIGGYFSGVLFVDKYFYPASTAWESGTLQTITFLKTDGFKEAKITIELHVESPYSWHTSRTYCNLIGAVVEQNSSALSVTKTFTHTIAIGVGTTIPIVYGSMNSGSGRYSYHSAKIKDITLA